MTKRPLNLNAQGAVIPPTTPDIAAIIVERFYTRAPQYRTKGQLCADISTVRGPLEQQAIERARPSKKEPTT